MRASTKGLSSVIWITSCVLALPLGGIGCDEPAGSLDGGVDGPRVDAKRPANTLISMESGSEAEAETVLAVGPGPVRTAAWMSWRDRGFVALARSEDEGASWRALGPISLGPLAQAVDPGLAVDAAGITHLVYLQLDQGTRSVWTLAIGTDGSFGPAVEVSDGVARDRDAPWIVGLQGAGAGAIAVVFSEERDDGDGPRDRLVLARSFDGGQTFVRSLVPGIDGRVPVAAVDSALDSGGTPSSALHLAALDRDRWLHCQRASDGGDAFDPPVLGLGRALTLTRPGMAAFGETVFLSFARDAQDGIALLRSSDGVSFVQSAVSTRADALAFLHPSVAVRSGGRVSVGFYATVDGLAGRWYAAASSDGGASFAPISAVSDVDLEFTADRGWPDWLGDYEQLVVAGEEVLSVWSDNRAGPSHVYFARGLP